VAGTAATVAASRRAFPEALGLPLVLASLGGSCLVLALGLAVGGG
jgi:hypothetical protein